MDGYQARETEQSFVGHDTTSLSFLIISICHGPSSVMHFNEIEQRSVIYILSHSLPFKKSFLKAMWNRGNEVKNCVIVLFFCSCTLGLLSSRKCKFCCYAKTRMVNLSPNSYWLNIVFLLVKPVFD